MEKTLWCQTFYSLVVYDIIGGSGMSLKELCDKHQQVFYTKDLSQYIKSHRKRIRDILFVPHVYIIPTRAIAFWWNTHIDRIWPLSTFSEARRYQSEGMPVYIKLDNKQLEEIKNLLHWARVSHYQYQAHLPVSHSKEWNHDAHLDKFYKSPLVDAYGLKFAPRSTVNGCTDLHIQTIC